MSVAGTQSLRQNRNAPGVGNTEGASDETYGTEVCVARTHHRKHTSGFSHKQPPVVNRRLVP